MRPWLLLFALLSGCATTGARAQNDIGSSAPSEAPASTPPAGDADRAAAQAQLTSGIDQLKAGDAESARSTLRTFLDRHPDDPGAGVATALLGRMALSRGDAAAAKAVVERHTIQNTSGVTDPSLAFVLGVAESRLGNGSRALELLKPFEGAGAPTPGGVPYDDGDLILRAALAEARAQTGDVGGAIAQWDRYMRLSGVRDHEKAYARQRALELGSKASPDVALQALRANSNDLARAALGAKAAVALRARGDVDGARRLEDDLPSQRRSLGFEGAAPWQGPGDPSRLGLAVPLSGRLHILGEVALRGAMLAIGEPTSNGQPAPFQILVRDTATGGDRPDVRTAELVREEAVIGIVGVGDRRTLDMVGRDGVPFLSLEDQIPGGQTTAFQLIHSLDGRAAELARRALALGARSFAILGPDSSSGQRLADAFKRAVTAGGGRVVTHATYIAGASSFTSAVAQLRRSSFDALFVPDDSDRLELVAPALAVADLWSRPAGGVGRRASPAGSKRREVLLLTTAVGLSKRLVKNAGRYVQGALLSPGFFAADGDARTATFLNRFRQLYNQEPSATDAYGFDGVRLLRTAVERGARTRADVLRLLASQSFEGVTGTLRFGPDHARIDRPLVYTVEGEEIHVVP